MNRTTPRSIRHRGKQYRVQGTKTVQRRKYLLLRQLGRRERQRWLALPARNGPLDGLVVLHSLPTAMLTQERLRILQKLVQTTPYVPRILDAQFQHEEVLVVTDWIAGQTLRAYLDRTSKSTRPISPYEAVRLYLGLTQTLCGFHRGTGLIHGDVTPENLVIRSKGNRLSLIDFGSAWRVVQTVHREVGEGHRVSYAAPEVLLGEPANERSDQFSATAILFEMLTGEIPYEQLGGRICLAAAEELADLWTAPSKRSTYRERFPQRLWQPIDALTAQGLAVGPHDRFPTRSAWLDATTRLFRELDQRPAKSGLADWWMRCVQLWRKPEEGLMDHMNPR